MSARQRVLEVLRFDGDDADVIAIVDSRNRTKLLLELNPTTAIKLVAELSVACAESFAEQAEARQLAADIDQPIGYFPVTPTVDPAREADEFAALIPTDEDHYPVGAGLGRTYPRTAPSEEE